MKITKIEQQKKRRDRYSVYINDEFAFGLGEQQLVELGISKGQEISKQELEKFLKYSHAGKAYDRAIAMIARRPRSRKEIRDYLARKDYDEPTIDSVVTKLIDKELLNDAQFAKDWVSWRQATTPRSRRRLQAELRKKGVDQEEIESALEAVGHEEELEQIKEIIEKRARNYDSEEKLMAYLARQGYNYDVIRQALDERD